MSIHPLTRGYLAIAAGMIFGAIIAGVIGILTGQMTANDWWFGQ